jgi:hypothetical protein
MFSLIGSDLVQFLVETERKHKFIAEQIGQSLLDKLLIYRYSILFYHL